MTKRRKLTWQKSLEDFIESFIRDVGEIAASKGAEQAKRELYWELHRYQEAFETSVNKKLGNLQRSVTCLKKRQKKGDGKTT